ncbi:hypothetical protein QE152_g24383 [Popillia japonica]|uniref:Uncharacterized protein n=1 Tax=Popillia japonica TaxID=7064 RepID=A0AAW1KGB1_POPJA
MLPDIAVLSASQKRGFKVVMLQTLESLIFFKSMLPDIAVLSASQKRGFKVVMLQTLESVLLEVVLARSTPVSTSPMINDRRATNSSSINSSDIAASNIAHVPNNHASNFITNPSTTMFINESIRRPISLIIGIACNFGVKAA